MKRVFLLVVALCFFNNMPFSYAEWKNESEAGIVITEGNSKSQSLHMNQKTSYQFTKNTLSFAGSYLQSKSAGVLSSRSWSLMLRYDRKLNEKLGVFLSEQVESNKFAGFLQRYNTDLGTKYIFLKEEKILEFFAEAGYRYTRERKTNGAHLYQQKARLYSEFFRQWNDSLSTKLWVEFIPNFSVSQEWLLNSEASFSVMMNSILSLKTAYLVNYSNQPALQGAKNLDSTFTTSLVAKF